MPNHLHVLFGFRCADKSINTIVSNGKRFMAYAIIKRLQEQNKTDILNQLSHAVTASDQNRGKLHQVFKLSLDCKECLHDSFIVQKLSYIHKNPCTGVWNLAESPINYWHSPAKFYHTGEHAMYAVTNYNELLDVDLTRPCNNRHRVLPHTKHSIETRLGLRKISQVSNFWGAHVIITFRPVFLMIDF